MAAWRVGPAFTHGLGSLSPAGPKPVWGQIDDERPTTDRLRAREVPVERGHRQRPAGATARPTRFVGHDANRQSGTLTWAPPTTGGPVTRYRLEAGSAPTRDDIATLDVGATSFSTLVARGTYYVRVRGMNAAGDGAPSNEVVVAIP